MNVCVDCVCEGRRFKTYEFQVEYPPESEMPRADDYFIRQAKGNLILERLALPPFYHIEFIVRRSQGRWPRMRRALDRFRF